MLYLDHAATTPIRPEARAAMEPWLGEGYGNPSGIHEVSRRAKAALETARETAARLLGAAHPLDIVFTGGGTGSDNLGVAGPALAGNRRGGVATTAVEHEAVLETARFLERLGCPLAIVGVDGDGVADPAEIAAAVGPGTAVVSVMAANNETGARQPLLEIAGAVREAGAAVIHTDAVQSFVSEEVTLASTGADLITLASHKFGGPKGVGLLVAPRSIALEPVIHGGGQELGRRSGTHNVAGIVGMVAAMEAAAADRERFRADVGEARRRFEAALAGSVDGFAVTAADRRLIQHSHVRFPGVSAETLLILLDGLGLAGSAGSACHSGAISVSHVLAAMGMGPGEAAGCVRFSFGWTSRPEDGDDAAAVVLEALEGLR
ncbi:MAG: cysteine desulfurase [Actinobacteria bacterium]|nr:cysteine desulfurase [Actinomycetota bacterium]